MSGASDMAERHGRILAELSELGLSLVRRLHEAAVTAEEPRAAAELAGAFHRISRSVRQTLALEARLERDRARQDREDRAEAARRREARIGRRKAEVRAALERLIWTEAEGEEAEDLLCELDELLERDALTGGFAEAPLETCIARLHRELDLASPPPLGEERAPSSRVNGGGAAAASNPAPSPACDPGVGERPWRSSA